MTVKPAEHADPVHWCDVGTVAQAVHEFDPKLTMMLSAVSFYNMKTLVTKNTDSPNSFIKAIG